MKKFDAQKNGTTFFQAERRQKVSIATGCALLLLLMFTLMANGAYAQVPTLDYGSAQTYKQGTAITPLVPTASGVAPFGYSSTAIRVLNCGGNVAQGLAFDSNGNLFTGSDESNTTIEEFPGSGGAKIAYGPILGEPLAVATDMSDNLYVADLTGHAVYKIPAGGGPAITLSTAIQNPYGIAVDRLGNVFVLDSKLGNLWKLPATGDAVLLGNYGAARFLGMALDNNGNIYLSVYVYYNHESVIKIPPGGGPAITFGTPAFEVSGLVADPAGNVFVTGSGVQMLRAGGGSPVSIGPPQIGFGSSYLTLDKYGSIFVSTYEGYIKKIKRTGGYFISPSLPPGLNFDENTGIISGTPGLGTPPTNYVISAYNESGKTSTTISINILPASRDADLSMLKLSDGVLSPAFSPSITNYSTTVVNGVRSVKLTPITASPQSRVTVNGTAVADSATSAAIPLTGGANAISIVVTAPDKVTTKTYTLTVNKAVTGNDNLTWIKLSAGTLSPAFSAATTGYTVNVTNQVTHMTITPASGDADAMIKVNGATVASGAASPVIPLSIGANNVSIVVTSSNGSATKTYTITVNRPSGNNDNLSSITPSRGALSPAFAAATTNYTVNVVNGVTFMTVTATGDPDATIKVNGTTVASGTASSAIPLSLGANTISIAVTSSDGTATKTYTLTINRQASANALLKDLTLSNGTLSPGFSATMMSYSAGVGINLPSMTVTPYAGDPGATIRVNGIIVASGAVSARIPVSLGITTINIVVTAADGTTTKTYKLAINRGDYNSFLSSLAINAKTPPTGYSFYPYSLYFTANVGYEDSVCTVTPTKQSTTSMIKVNGVTVASGTASGPIPLAIGLNTINIVVTAQNGVAISDYQLAITRADLGIKGVATLSAITANRGKLTFQVFNDGAYQYIDRVVNGVSSISITPTATNPLATITVNGAAVRSGTASDPIALNAGIITINILVTAEDGRFTQAYTITVYRAGSNNAYLSSIKLDWGELSPSFAATTTSYTSNVPAQVASITISPIAQDSTANIFIDGVVLHSGNFWSFSLSPGANTFNLHVSIPGSAATKTYTLTINRALSPNADLLTMALSAGTLTPQFSPDIINYTANVPYSESTIRESVVAGDNSSAVQINGSGAFYEVGYQTIPLVVGSNTITTTVTESDGAVTGLGGAVTKTYTVTVTRAPAGSNSFPAGISNTKLAENSTSADVGIVVHQGISPNGDGINDYLVIDGILAYPDNKLSIMNRNGQLVFEAKGYDNASKVFDGHSNKNGQMQLPGTYFYSLEYTVNGIVKHKTGYLVLKY